MSSVDKSPSSISAGDLLKSDNAIAVDITPSNEAASDHTERDAIMSARRTGDSRSIIQKTFGKTTSIELTAYNMSSPHRGHAVIVNNETFEPITSKLCHAIFLLESDFCVYFGICVNVF